MARSASVLFVVLLASLAAPHVRAAAKPDVPARPNIVIVVADDMGWRDTGYQGNPDVKTPNLDDMASRGVRFDYFYAAQQMCSPGRFAIMTGRAPFRTGLHQLGSMRAEEITIPKALKTAGYHTAHFGKWHLGENRTSPKHMGFDEAIWKLNFFDLGATLQVGDTKETVALKGDTSVATMDLALDFIRKQAAAKEPFFTQVCFGSPHSPHQAAPEFKSLYKDVDPNRQDFLGEVSGLDAAVGNLRAELKKLGIADNTIVWFTSDNGGITPQSQDPSGKGKHSIGSRTVAVLEWPEYVKKPIQTSLPCGQWDIYPTLLEIVGVTMPHQPVLDGISLVPLLDGKLTERPKQMGFMLCNKGKMSGGLGAADFVADTQAVWIDGKYRLVVHPTDTKKADAGVSLYDIFDDPAQKKNLADEHPDVVKKMRADLDAWRTSVRASYDGKDFENATNPTESKKKDRKKKGTAA